MAEFVYSISSINRSGVPPNVSVISKVQFQQELDYRTGSKMNFSYVFLVVCLAAGAYSREYPAGLFPALCPDYPNCDNALLARYYPDGQPKPEYELAAPYVAAPVHSFRSEYPADVPAAACPNYPFCNVAVSADPLPGFATRQYPAGVPAAACPGYPFC